MVVSGDKKEINRLVILGGGTAGWMTAAALAKLLPADLYHITLVESEHIGTVGVGEATLPHLRFFNQRLGINEADFMKSTQATFKLGIQFNDWQKTPSQYIHPFGNYGDKVNGIGVHHYWLAQKQYDSAINIEQYSLSIQACLAGKFDFPSADPTSLLSHYSYAYHLDAGLYAKYLRQFSEQLNVQRIEGKVIDVIVRQSDQHIEQLILANGQRIDGDFFIDCSGFRAQLIEQVYHSGYEDWSHWLPCNKAVAMACEAVSSPLPYTKATAQTAGWQWQIPLQHRLGNGYVYSDQFMTQQDALNSLTQNLAGKPLTEPNFLSFQTGKRKKSWINNCLAIGLSAGFLEPLESTSIYLIQSAIMQLIELIPQQANLQMKAQAYNSALDSEMERIRDFLILHYHATDKTSAFWQYCQNMPLPSSLEDKITLFKETAHVHQYHDGLFQEQSWLSVYFGQGIIPKAYDSRIATFDAQAWQHHFKTIRQQIVSAVNKMPDHQVVIGKYCQSNLAG